LSVMKRWLSFDQSNVADLTVPSTILRLLVYIKNVNCQRPLLNMKILHPAAIHPPEPE